MMREVRCLSLFWEVHVTCKRACVSADSFDGCLSRVLSSLLAGQDVVIVIVIKAGENYNFCR